MLLLAWVTASATAAGTGQGGARPPKVLDSQQGIQDGENGLMLQTAPLLRAPIVAPQPMAAPAELAPSNTPPLIVAPYIEYPVGRPVPYPPHPPHPPRPHPQPMPTPPLP
ncbi:hypothetical protein [Paraburkholderia hayleyella]|uniref:hypothetical protein n=1 Tax=Paraburkholderia hayleyella TaxID=2152889 RepID=UPI001FE5531E|nr:hypothetical protein [Paraburkholderia hayleyella]